MTVLVPGSEMPNHVVVESVNSPFMNLVDQREELPRLSFLGDKSAPDSLKQLLKLETSDFVTVFVPNTYIDRIAHARVACMLPLQPWTPVAHHDRLICPQRSDCEVLSTASAMELVCAFDFP
jgi:hypothetical protein